MLECVPNVAEGRDRDVLDLLVEAAGPSLLDLHVDADHHRSVFTLAGPASHDAETAVAALARAAAAALDLSIHEGAHPRLGIVDVVPFIALDDDHEVAIDAARAFAEWIAVDLEVPVFLYDDADPLRRSLPELRRDAFRSRAPDLGPTRPHPTLGATAVGARPPLIAVNCWLDTNDGRVARQLAGAVRERDGGLGGVRALGFVLDSADVAQVSMNLVDLPVTGLQEACEEVRRLAIHEGYEITRVEVVGLIPTAELERCSPEFRKWAEIGPELTIEGRMAARESEPPGD